MNIILISKLAVHLECILSVCVPGVRRMNTLHSRVQLAMILTRFSLVRLLLVYVMTYMLVNIKARIVKLRFGTVSGDWLIKFRSLPELSPKVYSDE